MSSSVQGSSGSFDITPQSPLGTSRCTHNRQKIIKGSVGRKRMARLFFFFLLMNGSSLFFWQSKRKPDPKGAENHSSSDDVVWSSLTYAFYCWLWYCAYTYIFCPAIYFFLFFFSLVGRGASFCDRWCYGERSGDSSIYCCLRYRGEGRVGSEKCPAHFAFCSLSCSRP